MLSNVVKVPVADMGAVGRGDADAFFMAVAAHAAGLFSRADSHIGFPLDAVDVARHGFGVKAGLLAAALDLRTLLAQSPQGRQALRNFGFEPVSQDVERE